MKRRCSLLLCLALLFTLGACGSKSTASGETEWVLYWYLCGSDLESEYASATTDLEELLSVDLPDSVQVVIQTGGAATWQNDTIDAEKTQRWLYSREGLQLLEESEPQNMGDPETLVDFLDFAKTNYPAKHTMISFWNHGGGSVTGVAFDELFNLDSLTLSELYAAFSEVYTEAPGKQPIDLIGFDSCLMASIDTAYTFSDFAKYMVASQEVEPTNGWLYSGFVGALAKNPKLSPAELGRIICDSYVEGCAAEGTDDSLTLSLTNLSKVGALVEAYDAFGQEALLTAVENPSFFAQFARVANNIENYGGNTREQGFANMADLGHLARNMKNTLPESATPLLSALEDCVEYKVHGTYRSEATGLSCYYSYNGDFDNFMAYTDVAPSDAFRYFYALGLTGELPQEGLDYLSSLDDSSTVLPTLPTLNQVNWENTPITVDTEGCGTMTLGPQAVDVLASISFQLYYANAEEDFIVCLGSDNNIVADWENGVFKDNFQATWGSLDGALCYMEIAYVGEDYNLYSVPILLNGEPYNLSVVYDFTLEDYYIAGARKGLDASGAADKNLRYLIEGDQVQTVHYSTEISTGSDELLGIPVETITVTANTTFSEIQLFDGLFVMLYEMSDCQGNVVYSAPFTFEVTPDGQIFTSPSE